MPPPWHSSYFFNGLLGSAEAQVKDPGRNSSTGGSPAGTHAPALVVLAAGQSRRLGSCKALVELRPGDPTSTPLARLLEHGAGLGASIPPLVITGAEHGAILAAAGNAASVVRNTRWKEGRTGSVQLAQRTLAGRDLCLAPVDVPLVPREVFESLAAAWRRAGSPERGWLAPWVASHHARHPGRGKAFGHPVLLGRGLLAELAPWPRDRPLHALRARATPLLEVQVDSGAILDDLDTPEDLERLRARAAP